MEASITPIEIETSLNTSDNTAVKSEIPSQETKFKNMLKSYGSAYTFLGALGASSLLLKPMENFEKISQIIGSELPKVIRNQGFDIAGPSLATLTSMVLFANVFKGASKEGFADPRTQRATAVFGMAVSTWYTLSEVSRISNHSISGAGTENFDFVSVAKGDLGDVVALSVPLIAGVIHLSGDLAKEGIKKINERNMQKERMHDIDQLQ